jgi:hypothetical protein
MPMRLTDLMKNTIPITFDYEGQTCNLEYRPSAITMKMHMAAAQLMLMNKEADIAETDAEAVVAAHRVNQAEAQIDGFGSFAEAVVALVAKWDVLGEDGAPIPITQETMVRLPRDFVYAIWAAIMAAYAPNRKRVKA